MSSFEFTWNFDLFFQNFIWIHMKFFYATKKRFTKNAKKKKSCIFISFHISFWPNFFHINSCEIKWIHMKWFSWIHLNSYENTCPVRHCTSRQWIRFVLLERNLDKDVWWVMNAWKANYWAVSAEFVVVFHRRKLIL